LNTQNAHSKLSVDDLSLSLMMAENSSASIHLHLTRLKLWISRRGTAIRAKLADDFKFSPQLKPDRIWLSNSRLPGMVSNILQRQNSTITF
jgi:hypothetical protein